MARVSAIVTVLVLVGCSRPPPPSEPSNIAADSGPVPTPAVAGQPKDPGPGPGPPTGFGGADELHRLEGVAQAEVLAEFGEPTDKRVFTMAECCHEFEVELLNTYPPDKGHDDVEIREWTWDYDGYALTLWLHQHGGAWVVLETSRYEDGVEF